MFNKYITASAPSPQRKMMTGSLPPGWELQTDEEGKILFVDQSTGMISHSHPLLDNNNSNNNNNKNNNNNNNNSNSNATSTTNINNNSSSTAIPSKEERNTTTHRDSTSEKGNYYSHYHLPIDICLSV